MAHLRDLTPDPQNRRSHTPRNVGMLADALRAVGAARSIVIDEHGVVLAGNATIDAAAEAGIERVQIVDADGSTIVAVRRSGLTDEQKRALALYDNRTAELAAWNVEQLGLDAAAGLDLETFWTPAEQRRLLGDAVPHAGHTDDDDTPAPRATGIVPGDVFALGRHRVICGDAIEPATIAALLGDATVACVWGDPPYGVAHDPAELERLRLCYGPKYVSIDDDAAPWDATFVVAWITSWIARVMPGGYFASWAPYQGIGTVERHALDAGLLWLNLFTWGKDSSAPGFPEYLTKASEHAAIFRKPGTGRYVGPEPVRDYVVAGPVRGAERYGHPSPKPVDVVRPVVGKLVARDGVVADPFLGSGTMLVVCESIDRVCVGVERDPVYVQVAIDRWEAFTGQRAEKRGAAS